MITVDGLLLAAVMVGRAVALTVVAALGLLAVVGIRELLRAEVGCDDE